MNIAQTNSSPINNFIKWSAPYALVAVSFFAGKEEAKGQTDFIPNVGYVPSGSVQQDYSRPQIFLQENARLPQRQAHAPAAVRPVLPVYHGGYYQQPFFGGQGFIPTQNFGHFGSTFVPTPNWGPTFVPSQGGNPWSGGYYRSGPIFGPRRGW